MVKVPMGPLMLKLCNISKHAHAKNAFVDWMTITNENILLVTMNMNILYAFATLTSILRMYTMKYMKFLFEISLWSQVLDFQSCGK